MEKPKLPRKPHCLVIPYPLQGHINPMLQFSERLHQKQTQVTLITTRFMYKTITQNTTPRPSSSIPVKTISDGFDEAGRIQAQSITHYLETFQKMGSETLTELVKELKDSGNPVDCIVYDAFIPWCLDVCKSSGIFGAVFFTQSCAVGSLYYRVLKGVIKVPVDESDRDSQILVPGLSTALEARELPSFFKEDGNGLYPGAVDMLVNQFDNIDGADWVLCNSVYDLESQVVDWMKKMWRVMTIGPTIPLMYLDKRLQHDIDYGLNIFKPNSDICMKWLNNKPKRSVMYIAFGSLAALNTDQMRELSSGLLRSECQFLWVIRESEHQKLPRNFIEDTREKGLVVSWCPQLEVMSSEAIGCFITHCGWNSTLEALSLGVPMIVMPQWTDQPTNAKFIVDVWKVGVEPEVDNESRIVRRESMENCVREIMEGEKGKEIRENARKVKDLIYEAMCEGGNSDQCINEFVANLITNC